MLKTLANFIEKLERAFPQEGIPSDKRDADKQLKGFSGPAYNLGGSSREHTTASVLVGW